MERCCIAATKSEKESDRAARFHLSSRRPAAGGTSVCAKEVEYDRALSENLLERPASNFSARPLSSRASIIPTCQKFRISFPMDARLSCHGLRSRQGPANHRLDPRREKRFLPEQEVLGWAHQLANALDYLHTQEWPSFTRYQTEQSQDHAIWVTQARGF